MPCTAASTKRVLRKNARIGKEQWRASRVPEQTSKSSGVITRKLSRLTRTISTSRRRLQSCSRWPAVTTPPKPPPRITILVFGGCAELRPFVLDKDMLYLLEERDEG